LAARTNPAPPGRGVRRRRLLWTAGAAVVLLLAAAQYVRARYDVTATVRAVALDWASAHTRWLVASPERIDAEASAALAAWPFERGEPPRAATGPLHVLAENPRYFADGEGNLVYLAGSHTWQDFQDSGHGDPPDPFDYDRFLDFLTAHHHNFIRMWVWEQARWTLETSDADYTFNPMGPFVRSGPGEALDGRPRWDLTRFEDAWFDRLHERVAAAGERGIYVAVMLFNGWSVAARKPRFSQNDPWRGHPFNAANNVNGIDGDLDGDGGGTESHELRDPRILAIQEAYVRKVIDTVGDLDNVLWEISNESHAGSLAWQRHMVALIKAYEETRPKAHPVGVTAMYPGGRDADLFASDADWVSPGRYADPPASDGSKVIIADTDHIFGIGGDERWVWKSFTRGLNVAFMDGYDGAGYGTGGKGFDLDDPRWVQLRRSLGYTRGFAQRMALEAMTPRPDACSTTWCLASVSGERAEFLVYAPQGGAVDVDLSAATGSFVVAWFSPGTGVLSEGGEVAAGQWRTFVPPRSGGIVLHLSQPTNRGT